MHWPAAGALRAADGRKDELGVRLLFLSNFYPPHERGGYEQWCQEVADAFRARGHRVVVVTSRYGSDRIREPEPDVHRALFLESDIEHYRPLEFFTKLPRRDRFNLNFLSNTIGDLRPNAVLIWGMWQLNPELAVLTEELCPDRVGYYFCGFWPIKEEELDPHMSFWLRPENRWWKNWIKRPIAQVALAQLRHQRHRPDLRHVTCVSKFVLGTYHRHGLAQDGRVLYGGIPLDKFYRRLEPSRVPRRQPLRLLYAGHVAPQKGVDTAVKAIAELAPKFGPDAVHLTIVGSGHPSFGQYLRDFARDHAIDAYVTFRDWIHKDQMPQLMHEFDVMLFPSVWGEPLARTMMQGMASGLTLVSTTTGGSGEVLEHGGNCLTFKAGDVTDLAQQIERLLIEPGLAYTLAVAGQRTALEKFGFDRMVDEMENFVKSFASTDSS